MRQRLYKERELLEVINVSKTKLFKLRKKHNLGRLIDNAIHYTEEEKDLLHFLVNRRKLSLIDNLRKTLQKNYPLTEYQLWIATDKFVDYQQFRVLLADLTEQDANVWEDDEDNIWYMEPMN